MANIITIKRSSVAGKQPNVADLQVGELALNLADGLIYSKNTAGNVIVVGSSTTSNVREGSNLYFTNARSQAAVANTNLILANLTTTGNLTVGSGIGGNITGVNNLYATNVYSNVVIANVWSGIYTANVVESTSLYFTNTRAISALTGGYGIVIAANGRLTVTATGTGSYGDADTYANVSLIGYATNSRIDGLTTTDIPEGSRPYFNNTRAISAFTAGSGISISPSGTIASTGGVSGNYLIDYGFVYESVSSQQDFGSIL